MHSLPELVHAVSEEEFDGKAITEKDEKVIAAYNQLKPFKRPKPNLGIKVTNYDLHIKSYMEDKDLKYSDLLEVYICCFVCSILVYLIFVVFQQAKNRREFISIT